MTHPIDKMEASLLAQTNDAAAATYANHRRAIATEMMTTLLASMMADRRSTPTPADWLKVSVMAVELADTLLHALGETPAVLTKDDL